MSSTFLLNIIDRLNDSNLVARIQKYFGIKFHQVVNSNSNNSNGTTNTGKDKIFKMNMLDDQKCLYSITNPMFYWFFMVCTHMGNEIFYILFLPLLAWNYSDKIMYLTCISWSLTMFIGQATKDILKIPRPLTPPVVKLEEKYLLEYGFPSTHAMAAISISYSMLNFMPTSDLTFQVKMTAFLACFLICLSRVYLGMHSFFDIIGGILYAYLLSFMFTLISDNFYSFTDASLLNGFLLFLLFGLVCIFYPSKRWSSARSDTFLIVGVGAGLILGMSLKSALDAHQIGKLRVFSWTMLFKRSIAGTVFVLAIRQISKLILHKLIRVYYKLKYPNVYVNDIKSIIRSSFSLDLLFYFTCYACISFTCIFSVFYLFEFLNFY